MNKWTAAVALGLLSPASAAYLQPPARGAVTRRECCIGAAIALSPLPAAASGGATAGKTTSIPRAKVRYYGRITEVIIAYNALGAAIKSGEGIKTEAAKFFNEKDDESPSAELNTAGYLLSVAFKIDGKIPPERIQQAKDHKKLMKDMKSLASASKEGASKAASAYETASASMDVWLEGVELPALGDKAYDPRTLPACAQPATGPCLRE
jgi:hypothetical protein